ncbi:hypothetical protein PV327_005304 [Microctonus hyperodae]|uniref:Alpha-1,3-glucosyltransferase n=1 Tax=Microctonus hyperodae TaxID=165561 RepID=A0AA39G1E6_MICHY|nr:hypothetical protein PV327_005304 [Microctonus hyperodae]
MHVPRTQMKKAARSKKKLITNDPSKDEHQSIAKFSFNNELWTIFIFVSAVKLLLVYTYHSTDFEVHRNWLAITHNLPINEWYTNNNSQWTLDYPPFFAWFEFSLSQFGKFVDPEMLKIDNLNYASQTTILFQRLTVCVSDLMLLYGVREIADVFCTTYENFITFFILSLFNVGLLMVDHIHFQYNGFMLGILLLSIAQVSKIQSVNILKGAGYFAALLNFKHIYLYVAPAFIAWLLKWYCWKKNKFFNRLIQLGIIVTTTLLISFGPFATQLPKVFMRLFPFKRGLVHAYWAANIWAVYIGADKILSLIWKKLGWLSIIKTAALTGGLVQENILAVLPTPTPLFTFIATIVAIIPVIFILLTCTERDFHPRNFIRCLILCALGSFIFGWHVHEKAILTAIIPLSILAVTHADDARIFLILSSTGHAAILPLLFPEDLILIKIIMSSLYTLIAALCLQRLFNQSLLTLYEWIYISIRLTCKADKLTKSPIPDSN